MDKQYRRALYARKMAEHHAIAYGGGGALGYRMTATSLARYCKCSVPTMHKTLAKFGDNVGLIRHTIEAPKAIAGYVYEYEILPIPDFLRGMMNEVYRELRGY